MSVGILPQLERLHGPSIDKIAADPYDAMSGNKMVTAIVLINTAQGRTDEVAQALVDMPGVSEAYSIAGAWDLVAITRVGDNEQLAELVAGGIQNIPGITATNTLIAFRAYSRHDLEAMWDIGNEELRR